MKPVDRQKICPNCDGRVAYDATQCTYCFTTLQVDHSASKIFTPPTTPQESVFTPPYPSKPAETKTSPIYAEKDGGVVMDSAGSSETKGFWPLLCLLLGGNLLTLGILQFFFSDRGIVRLEMNGSYWFLMLLVSLPLFYFGLKKSSQE